MKKNKKEKLIKDIFNWVVKDTPVDATKEKLLKIMIEVTLDYLYLKKYFSEEKTDLI